MDQEKQIVETLLEWHKENRRYFPWRDESDPYKVLVAEFFLQRTPANRVAALYPKFIQDFPSPEKLAHADPSHLKEISRSLGLKKRISWLLESMKVVCQRYNGRIPDTLEELIALPGVGKYTASAVLCFGFGRGVPIVDANVVRVLSRIYGHFPVERGHTNEFIKKKAEELVSRWMVRFNEALLDFAALVCKKKPLCTTCVINDYCDYYQK